MRKVETGGVVSFARNPNIRKIYGEGENVSNAAARLH